MPEIRAFRRLAVIYIDVTGFGRGGAVPALVFTAEDFFSDNAYEKVAANREEF